MKFAHLADVHVGAWRDPAMKGLSLEALRRAVANMIERRVDFVIIAGDLFNTAVPAIDHLQETVVLLKKLRDAGLPVYVVPGSHDYSAAGKTILDVLEELELIHIVMKGSVEDGKLTLSFTRDERTGVKLTGIGGRKGSLEQKEYAALDLASLESEPGEKIFLFHTSIEELKPPEMYAMLSVSINEFPRGFDYYAGGHVHVVQKEDFPGRPNVIYPGPIFPANFQELWNLGRGGFYIYDNGELEHVPITVKTAFKIDVSAESRTPEDIESELASKVRGKQFSGGIVMVRVHGKLRSGKPSDIDFRSLFQEIYNNGAYFAMRSTTRLTSEEFDDSRVSEGSAEELEHELIHAHTASRKHKMQDEPQLIRSLLTSLSDEQKDGEKKYEYDSRMSKEADSLLTNY